ncbi:hypothetical protein [Clostridium sp.]|uniref:hypothetical protein n=1 Tax=Clostridium sp. TaxID=1506 RepID=UPI00261CE361|nr:hypothetical protein [uncultured Clostridium sp.]
MECAFVLTMCTGYITKVHAKIKVKEKAPKTSAAPTYTIDPEFLARYAEVVKLSN